MIYIYIDLYIFIHIYICLQTLEQALCLLKNCWAKRKASSITACLQLAQKESLDKNLLAHASDLTKGELLSFVKEGLVELVKKKAQQVLDDAKQAFHASICKSVENTLREV